MSAFELLLLEQLPDVGPVTVGRLVRAFGSAEKALLARDREFAGIAGAEAARARRDPERKAVVRGALDRARRDGGTVLSWDDDAYPERLRHLTDPPPVLFLRGRLNLLAASPSVTVVGARRSTARARDVSERLAAALARVGVCVASGLALGVDGSAHSGALRAGGDTVAVLGAGTDVAYPRYHRKLHRAIGERGLLVSEFPPGTTAAPHHFPRRNRILAALADVTVVVEAGHRSGSLITVDHALDLGREVWAVPGPIDAPTCEGSNRLLVDGARPLVSIDDFVERVAGGGPAQPDLFDGDDRPSSPLATPAPDPGASLETRVLELLRERAAGADELAEGLDVPVGTILAILTTLELHGEVVRTAGMRFRRAA